MFFVNHVTINFDPCCFFDGIHEEYVFFIDWQADLDFRLGLFALASEVARYITPTGLAHMAYTAIAKAITHGDDNMEFTQGYGDNWKSDTFAGQLIGYTFLAGMLEETDSNLLILDLSGEGTSEAPMQVLKRAAVAAAPQNLLRARGVLQVGSDGPKVISVQIQDPNTKEWMTFGPTDGTRWTIAKVTLFSLGNFVLQCYHTGIHLFAGALTSAIKRAVPVGTSFGKSIQPNTLQTIFALFEQAAALHSTHGSAFGGGVWPCNITEIWSLTVNMARFYLSVSDPLEIMGISSQSPAWWAGNSETFFGPISDFADSVAKETFESDDVALAKLQEELQLIGLSTSESNLDVRTSEGLAKLTKNFLFVAGICHTHMYLGREAFTPLMGFSETKPFLYYLQPGWSLWNTLGFETVVTKIWFTVPRTMNQQMLLVYGTTSGFSEGVPQLGDGPYTFEPSNGFNEVVANFSASLMKGREKVYEIFGNFRNGTFLPGYFYPKNVPKPYGYAITQTAYI